MPAISFDKLCYRVEGQPFYLYSGEFHYFRVPKKDWRRRMDLFREAGGNCIATYVPWMLHEPKEGQFNFGSADGLTDFETFQETARQAGLYVLARPGPYQGSELKYGGLPAWLFEKYPEILARDIDNKPIHADSMSYLHPIFLQKTQAWFNVVCPIVARHTVSKGGSIALVQIDNEMMGVHLWNGSVDYSVDAMGIGRKDGRYPRYLQKKYVEIGALNAAYGTHFSSFEAVRPIAASSKATPPQILRAKDYFEFYLSSIGEYALIVATMMRSHGIDVPLVHNAGGVDMDMLYEDVVHALEPGFLLGSDHYYNLDQSWAQNNPTPQYALNIFCSLESLRLMGFPPTVLEMPGGSASDWPPITPEDTKACYWTNLALGMKGTNFYIFTGGPNPPHAGTTTDIYDYGAAISATGETRPLYPVQKELGDFLLAHPWLSEAERQYDFRVVVSLHNSIGDHYWKSHGDLLLSDFEAWDLAKRGVLNSSFCASLSPVLCDLRASDWSNDKTTPVAIVSSACMSAAQQQGVIEFLRGGGKAIILPVLPTHDENFKPCTLLSDFLGGAKLRPNSSAFPRITVNGIVNVECNVGSFVTETLPPKAQVIGKDKSTGETVAWCLKTEGGGEVIFLGFRWYHAMHEHEYLVTSLLHELGLQQKVLCSNPNVWTSLRSNGEKSMLFILNLSSSPMEAQITYSSAAGHPSVTAGHKLPPMTVQWVEAYQRVKDNPPRPQI